MPILLTSASAPATPWPTTLGAVRRGALGHAVWLDRGDQRASAWRWEMRRNCSISPGQLLAVYLSLCAVSLAIAGGFFMRGAQPVLVFAGVELLTLGLAMLIYARHAGDREMLTLAGRSLRVDQHDGQKHRHTEFRAEWLVVEPSGGQGSLVELSGQGRRTRVGRFLRPELRGLLAQELRSALRRACLTSAESEHRIESQDP